jgi:hypothetical protein
MKVFVTFRLKPGLTREEYDAWFREVNVPAVRQMDSIKSYRVWRVDDVVEGDGSFEVVEEMEIDDRAAFERELEQLPAVTAMLEGWYARVQDQTVLYAEEVAQQ